MMFMLWACNTSKEELGYYESGKLKYKVIYQEINGVKTKLEEHKFYENGQKEYSGTFNNNARTGKWIYWYENGNIWTTCEYQKGLKHGSSVIYFKNGRTKIMGAYQINKPFGKWVFYDEAGNVLKEVNYQ